MKRAAAAVAVFWKLNIRSSLSPGREGGPSAWRSGDALPGR